MATLNLTKIGGLVKVEYTGQADRYVSATNAELLFYMPSDGTAKIHVSIAGQTYDLAAITDIQVAGVAVTNQVDFDTKIATVFPDANTGSGTSTGVTSYNDLTDKPTIDAVPTDGSTNAVQSNGVYDALASKQPTPVLVTDGATALTLGAEGRYVFTGTNATWTLPAGTSGLTFTLFHRGTGTLTVNGTLFGQAAASSITLLTGDSRTVTWDGSYYLIY